MCYHVETGTDIHLMRKITNKLQVPQTTPAPFPDPTKQFFLPTAHYLPTTIIKGTLTTTQKKAEGRE